MAGCENNSEPRLTAHHQVVRFCGALKREHLVHRPHARENAEGECTLPIDRCPATVRSTLSHSRLAGNSDRARPATGTSKGCYRSDVTRHATSKEDGAA